MKWTMKIEINYIDRNELHNVDRIINRKSFFLYFICYALMVTCLDNYKVGAVCDVWAETFMVAYRLEDKAALRVAESKSFIRKMNVRGPRWSHELQAIIHDYNTTRDQRRFMHTFLISNIVACQSEAYDYVNPSE